MIGLRRLARAVSRVDDPPPSSPHLAGVPPAFRRAFGLAASVLASRAAPALGQAIVVGRGIEGLALCAALRGAGARAGDLVFFFCAAKKLARRLRAHGEPQNAREVERVARGNVAIVAFEGEAFYAASAVFLNAPGGEA